MIKVKVIEETLAMRTDHGIEIKKYNDNKSNDNENSGKKK